MLYVVSACLMGENCKYSGGNNLSENVQKLCENNEYILVCPEMEGGLDCPRDPAEIVGGDGEDVLKGKARVVTENGEDVTDEFVNGAYEVLEQIKNAAHVGEEIVAVLKSNSPSCGCGRIYDGTFSDKKIDGDGVTAALFKRKGIRIFNEDTV